MNSDGLVAVTTLPFTWQAELVAGALRSAGIECVVFKSDVDQNSEAPLGGARVMVRGTDAPEARRIIDEIENAGG